MAKKKKPEPITDPILKRADKLLKSVKSAADRDTALNELAELINQVDSIILREDYINSICEQFDVRPTIFKQLIKSKIVEPEATPGPDPVTEKPLPATLQEYIANSEVPGIIWKARKLLTGIDDQPLKRAEAVNDICRTIALYPNDKKVVKDDYVRRIATEFRLSRKTLEQYVADHTVIERKKDEVVRTARKNTLAKLEGKPSTFPFFNEQYTVNVKKNTKTFKGINVDIQKYLQFLLSFGFMRLDSGTESDEFNFIRLQENVIETVSIEKIKDFLEDYLEKEYDYEGAGCEEADSSTVINFFLDKIGKYFNESLFARLRSRTEIIISKDTEKECFLYYKNGFVRITADGYELLPYEKMDGSVWKQQMRDREFKSLTMPVVLNDDESGPDWNNTFTTNKPLGDYADFIWRISGQKQQRFLSLCTILGYLLHDYYDYKLKLVILTDSTVSEHSEGRTGKSLSMQMLGEARSYCEINGKLFNVADERKYQFADMSTQILHINDISHVGKNKFYLESVFNDILDGYWVRKMFMAPFHKRSKMAVSTNRSLAINGSSERDRVIEFEVSSFFSEHRSPAQYYGKWMGTGWSETDWTQFDNFICFCVQAFFIHGMIPPETINLEARKLLDGTSREFIEFMADIADSIKTHGIPWDGYMHSQLEIKKAESMQEFEFDKKILFERFLQLYPDFKANHFTQKRFTAWLRLYGSNHLGVKDPIERRSNGIFFIQFKQQPPTT